jgi:hypothetical protein
MDHDGKLWQAMQLVDDRGRAAMGVDADDPAAALLQSSDPVEYVRKLLLGTGLVAEDVHEFADTQATALITYLLSLPPDAGFAIVRGFLQQSLLVGYHARRLEDDARVRKLRDVLEHIAEHESTGCHRPPQDCAGDALLP